MKTVKRVNPSSHHWAYLVGFCILLAGLSLRANDVAPVEMLRLAYFDYFHSANPRPRLPVDLSYVVVIDIDEKSMARIGQWPWDRRVLARMTNNLRKAGTKAMVFDIVFAETGRMGGDDDFIKAINQHDVVVGIGAYGKATTGPKRSPLASKVVVSSPDSVKAQAYVPPLKHLVRNTPAIEAAAEGNGVFSLINDVDGKMRRLPTLFNFQNRLYPSLVVEAMRVAGSNKLSVVNVDRSGVSSVSANKDMWLPTDAFGRFWIYFSPADRIRYISAIDVLENRFDSRRIDGKIALIGTAAVGLGHTSPTPIDPAMDNLEIQAQSLENLLSYSYLERPRFADALELLIMLITGLIAVIGIPSRTALTAFVFFGGFSLAAFSATNYLFTYQLQIIDTSAPVLLVLAILVVNLAFRGLQNGRTEAETT